MFIEPTITWVPSGFSGYIWLNTKIVLKKDIVSLAAIFAALVEFLWLYPISCIVSLRAGPVCCILYNMYRLYTVKGLCSFCKRRCPTEHFFY